MRCTLLVGQCYRLSAHHKRLAAGTPECVQQLREGCRGFNEVHSCTTNKLHNICGSLCALARSLPSISAADRHCGLLPTIAFQWLVRAELDASATAGGKTLVYP